MTRPRWAASQEAVEAALTRGPSSVEELVASTGFSETSIRKALKRASVVQVPGFWPRRFALSTGEVESTIPVQVQYVKPVEYEPGTVGLRWMEGKAPFAKDLTKIDLNKLPLDTARERLRAGIATLLGVLVILDQTEDGPEWRTEVGL